MAPSATGPAPAGLSTTGTSIMCLPWSNAGLPSVSLPAGHAANGLPLGLQLIGETGADEGLLHGAAGIEQALMGTAGMRTYSMGRRGTGTRGTGTRGTRTCGARTCGARTAARLRSGSAEHCDEGGGDAHRGRRGGGRDDTAGAALLRAAGVGDGPEDAVRSAGVRRGGHPPAEGGA
ncbi:amidase family protein [Streptomyces tubercidicus]